MAVSSGRTQLGTPLPSVTLRDVNGNWVALDQYRNIDSHDGVKPLVVVFACNHCPYVRHIELELAAVVSDNPDVGFVAIMSNDISAYPDDDIQGLQTQLARAGWSFPYLIDADQSAALQFGAACTPDFFVYDRTGKLAYRGALDTSSPGNGQPLNGSLLREALSRTLADEPVPEPHEPAMGCGIKWLPNNERKAVSLA